MNDASTLIPEITSNDVEWVADLMRLESLDEPRRQFLMSRETLDVAACPGSGKTTLIVAKLAILARKWTHRSSGICVISHTNVAREEIQDRLGNSAVGQTLLGYPHFIGTIHGFVNQFLALPWLHSNGLPVVVIDDAATTNYRKRVLGRDFASINYALDQRRLDFNHLRIYKRDFSFNLQGTPFPFGENSNSYRLASRAVKESAQAGYYCHNEMFVWGQALLEDQPEMSAWISQRFPLVFIDEMQDTTDIQALVLNSAFPRHSGHVVVQRVGDPNQAIYDVGQSNGVAAGAPEGKEGSQTSTGAKAVYTFPDLRSYLEIPSSFRFGQTIASLASPLAVNKVQPSGLLGQGSKVPIPYQDKGAHAIFVFPDDSTSGVLDAYGHHVLGHLTDPLLRKGIVAAVGAVHRPDTDINPGDKAYPKSVSDYWANYRYEVAARDPVPTSLVGYLLVAQAMVEENHDLSVAVDKVASGLIRFANSVGDIGSLKRTLRSHRSIQTAIESDREASQKYRELLRSLLVDGMDITEKTWPSIRSDILQITRALCGETLDLSKGQDALPWSGRDVQPYLVPSNGQGDSGPNVYRIRQGERHVDIQLGSIHSVKGQTHLATLIMDTYNRTHFFGKLLPWLAGKTAFGNGDPSDEKRLRAAYVAMTRPSHVICLAMRRSSMGKDTAYDRNLQLLQKQGWRIAEMTGGAPVWR